MNYNEKKGNVYLYESFIEITNPAIVNELEEVNQTIDKWHSIGIKFPVC